MLTEDDIKVGVELVCIDSKDKFIQGVGTEYTIGKIYKVLQRPSALSIVDDRGVFIFITGEWSVRLKQFKLKETNMLDPEIYAVGTVHKHTIDKSKWRIIARNVKTDEFKSGVAMVVIDNGYAKPIPFAVCQETGVFVDGYDLGLYVAPKKHKGWICLYDEYITGVDVQRGREVFKNKAAALKSGYEAAKTADCKFIACIEIEYEEGQGL